MNRLLTTLFIFSLFFTGCQDEIEPGPDPACTNNSGWLRNGHELVFENNSLFVLADTLYTTLEEVSPGIFKTTNIYDNGALYPPLISYQQACGNSVFQSSTADMANSQEIYRMDGNVGDSWVANITSQGGQSVTMTTTIIARDVQVTVPAGTFNTVHMRSESEVVGVPGSSSVIDQYVSNAEGPVKMDSDMVQYLLARKNF